MVAEINELDIIGVNASSDLAAIMIIGQANINLPRCRLVFDILACLVTYIASLGSLSWQNVNLMNQMSLMFI